MHRTLAAVCLLVACSSALSAQPVRGVEPTFRVTGATPVPAGHVAGATTPVLFAVFDVETGGAPLWQEIQLLPLGAGGEYSAILGATSPDGLPADLFASGGPRWLAVRATAEGPADPPRSRLTSVPYALRAATAGDADLLGGLPASAFLRASGAGATTAVARRGGAGAAPVPLVNSGTAGYLGKFVNGVDLGNSVLYENAGSLGLGTTTPQSSLHVVASSAVTSGIGVQNPSTGLGSAAGVLFYNELGTLAVSAQYNNGGKQFVLNNLAAGGAFDFMLNSASKLKITSSGQVGLGMTPARKLDVADDGTGVRVSGGHPVLQVEGSAPSAAAPTSQLSLVRTTVPDNTTTTWSLLNNVTFSLNRDGVAALSLDANRTLTLATGTGDRLIAQGNIRVGTGTTGCVKDADGTVIAGTCSSDRRFKRDVSAFGPTLDRFVQLTPVHYYWRADEFADRRFGARQSWGLIAQDVAPLFPDLVTVDDDGYLAVNYSKLPLYTMQAVKELKAENDRLKAMNDELAARLSALEALVSRQ